MKRSERLRRLAESRQPDVTITVVLKDMSPAARGPVVKPKPEPTPVGDPAKTIAARRVHQAMQEPAPTGTRMARCAKCHMWNEIPAGEGGGVCAVCNRGGL